MGCIEIENLSIKYLKGHYLFQHLNANFEFGDYVLIDGDNGRGKSTLLKTILGLELKEKEITGKILINGVDILSSNLNTIQDLRSKVAYLEQKDEYESYYGVSVMEVLEDSYSAYKGRRLNKQDKDYITNVFNEYMDNNSRITLNSKINKLSGGQQRLISIIASLCLRKNSEIFIIDEPLNNLDFSMVKTISNLLNRIRIKNPKCLILMVSHCKIFPFINRVIRLEEDNYSDCRYIQGDEKICLACFGKANDNGFY